MMLNSSQTVKKYPLTTACIGLIWVLSFLPFFPETPLNDVQFIDKWTHLVMYGGTCCVLWWEYLRQHERPQWRRLAVWALLAPILMSGLIELLQAYCTGGRRSGEWADLGANAVGVVLAFAAGSTAALLKGRKEKPEED